MNKVAFLAIIILLLAASSCRTPKDFVFRDVENFNISKGNLKQAQLSMDVRLYNPNNYRMKLKKADLDVFMSNDHLGKMNVAKKYTVPRMDTFLLPVTLDVDMQKVLPNALQLFLNSEVTVKLTGSVKAGRHGVFVRVPVNYEGKQDIRRAIKL